MAPSIALDEDGFVLGIGSSGAGRLRTAIVGVSAGVLDEGVEPQAAVERPRFHREQDVVNAEPGVEESALAQLERRGLEVRRWPEPNYYFGGVSLVSKFERRRTSTERRRRRDLDRTPRLARLLDVAGDLLHEVGFVLERPFVPALCHSSTTSRCPQRSPSKRADALDAAPRPA